MGWLVYVRGYHDSGSRFQWSEAHLENVDRWQHHSSNVGVDIGEAQATEESLLTHRLSIDPVFRAVNFLQTDFLSLNWLIQLQT